MKKTGILVIMAVLLLPFAIAAEGDYVKFQNMQGDSLDVFQLTADPLFLPAYNDFEEPCEGDECRRFISKDNYEFNISNGTDVVGKMVLNGVVFIRTTLDRNDFDGISMMWGIATLSSYSGQFNHEGVFPIVLEYWSPSVGAFAVIEGTGADAPATQYDNIDMTRILSGNEIIIHSPRSIVLENVWAGTQHEVEVADWGDISLEATYETFNDEGGAGDIINYSVNFGIVNISNSSKKWVLDSWGKTFFNTTSGKYVKVLYGIILDETDIVDLDEDGYDSTVDCNDSNGDVWQLLSGYADNDGDTYTAGGAVELCSGESLPEGYAETQNPEDCDDNDYGRNPGNEENPGNSYDEDCSGADLMIIGNVLDGLGEWLYHANVTANCGGVIYSTITGDGGGIIPPPVPEEPPYAEGNYELLINTPGPCEVSVWKNGFVTNNDYSTSTDIGIEAEEFTMLQDSAVAGTVSGFVYLTSPIGPLQAIKVAAVDDLTGEVVQVKYSADTTGAYQFVGLPAGVYDFEASGIGLTYPSAEPFFTPAYDVGVAAGSLTENLFLWMDVLGGVE